MKKGTAIFPGWLFPFVYCVAGVDAYTREAGKIFDAYQVDLTMPDFLHHCRKLRPVKIRTSISIIRELKPRIFGKYRMIVKVSVDEHIPWFQFLVNTMVFSNTGLRWGGIN